MGDSVFFGVTDAFMQLPLRDGVKSACHPIFFSISISGGAQ